MSIRSSWITAVTLLCVTFSFAEVKVATDRNQGDDATPDFKFAKVPSPSKDDAATKAKFTIVDGGRDQNGGDLDVLNDGRLPENTDDPSNNFFFDTDTDTGRLAVDLGSAIDVKQVNTYSWHANTRGPQVYKLYASDGSEKDFDAAPKNGTDPEKHGWKLIAKVDTRPKEGEMGGQYGVSISDSDGSIGKYRYLLFETSKTETDDPFGNTFYSEIDVIDKNAGPKAEAPAPAPQKNSAYTIIIDTSRTPDLADWAKNTLRPVLEQWYPKIVEMFPSEGYTAPKQFTVTFVPDMQGVAYTARTHVVCAEPWFKHNLRGEAVGAVVHEMVHVVQQYHHRGNPGWLVEGLADYVRWFMFEPVSKRPHPNPARAHYDDSYRTSAAFINFVAQTYGKDIPVKLNASMRQGKYSEDLWKQYTGKTPQELWDQYAATLQKR